jgi:hypothetical protein
VYTGKMDKASLYRGKCSPGSGPGEEADRQVAVSFSIRDLFGNAALTVSGHLRRAPDPACESALRAAFAELDAELAEILGDRTQPGLLRTAARP